MEDVGADTDLLAVLLDITPSFLLSVEKDDAGDSPSLPSSKILVSWWEGGTLLIAGSNLVELFACSLP